MRKKEYSSVFQRLELIREEIEKLKQTPISSIKDRIEILRKANVLLKEQNSLLLIRQSFLVENNFNSKLQQTG